jgi:hypothetical protein
VWPSSNSKTEDRGSAFLARLALQRILLDAPAAAEALSISERAFHGLRKRPDFPRDATVVLGPRTVRFRVDVLYTFARTLVSDPQDEPPQLQRSRGIGPEARPGANAKGAAQGQHGVARSARARLGSRQ